MPRTFLGMALQQFLPGERGYGWWGEGVQGDEGPRPSNISIWACISSQAPRTHTKPRLPSGAGMGDRTAGASCWSPLALSRGVREPCSDTVINWPAISLSILLHAEGPADNEVMNSRSDLTIDLLFTIVTANAFNDPPARPHPRRGLRRPRPLGNLSVTLVASHEHPILACGQCEKAERWRHVSCASCAPLPSSEKGCHLPSSQESSQVARLLPTAPYSQRMSF